jgi:hypothetical protein
MARNRVCGRPAQSGYFPSGQRKGAALPVSERGQLFNSEGNQQLRLPSNKQATKRCHQDGQWKNSAEKASLAVASTRWLGAVRRVYKVDVPPTFSPSFFSSATSTLFIAIAITRRQRNQISLQHTRFLRSRAVPHTQPAKWSPVQQPRRNRWKDTSHSSFPAHLDHTEGTTRQDRPQEVESNRYVSRICRSTIALTRSR